VIGVGTDWTENMEGAHLIGPDGNSYEIGRVKSTTTLFLSTPYGGATLAGQTYTIRRLQYPLPSDCVDYDGITARSTQRGALRYVDRQTEEFMNLDFTVTGDPELYLQLGSPHRRTPDKSLSASLVAGGNLTAGITYVYKYRWAMAGTSSGSSPLPDVEATPTGGNLTVRLGNFLECSSTEPRQAEVYRAEKSVGAFYRIYKGEIAGGVLDDDGSASKIPDPNIPWVDDGLRWYIQFWPRAETSEELEVRYHFRPPRLQKLSDLPMLPLETHPVLKDLVLAEIFAKHSDARAAIYRRSAEMAIREMQARYLAHTADKKQRGAWHTGQLGGTLNYGTLTHSGT
jgi:hypothetical protein